MTDELFIKLFDQVNKLKWMFDKYTFLLILNPIKYEAPFWVVFRINLLIYLFFLRLSFPKLLSISFFSFLSCFIPLQQKVK